MVSNKLIISNTAISTSESNGRILSLLFNDYDDTFLHNYYLGGCPDKRNVYYLGMGDILNIKSILSFGHFKPSSVVCVGNSNGQGSSTPSKKKAIHYFLRNILYMINFHITRYMVKYIKVNHIESIFLFGADSPFLYRLSRKLSKKCKIPLEIYTCEDYPLKDYNYIQGGKHNNNIFFKLLIKSLKKQAKKAYLQASKGTFNSELLCEDYQNLFKINNPSVRYLPSILEKVEYKPREIKHIVYGGNLYTDRVNSLLGISKILSEINKEVVIDVYGKTTDENITKLKSNSNINYHGVVDYSKMIEIYKNADMLLHVDGFSDYSIKDYKHAFSTKISDCYMLGIPFFIYAPIDIASTQYAYKMNKDYTATSIEDLKEKLNNIVNNHLPYNVDYKKIKKDFSATRTHESE